MPLRFEPSPDTFLVEEVPLYEASGEGPHTYLWIEKRGLTTPEALRRLARALGVNDRDLGYAGLKDRHAVTRQWVSVPAVDPAVAQAVEIDGLRVLTARRHQNKLRTGHLAGNRFEVVLQGATAGDEERVHERLRSLARDGLPNRFGEQRFGASGDSATRGLAILRGQARENDRRLRRLLLSAAQSAIFNEVLALRQAGPGLRTALAGDVLQKTDTGGPFVCTDPAVDQARVDAGAVVPTGPLPGSRSGKRILEPPPGTPARQIEDRAFENTGATREDFARGGRELPGTRRHLVVPVNLDEPAVVTEAGDDAGRDTTDEPRTGADQRGDRLRVRFRLPPGAYATVLVSVLTS